jgi:hypothetical protein
MVGDLDLSFTFLARAAWQPDFSLDPAAKLTAQHFASASKIIEDNDPVLGLPVQDVMLRHLEAKGPTPPWLAEIRQHYFQAQEAAKGQRYLEQRAEFAIHFLDAVAALRANSDPATRAIRAQAAAKCLRQALDAYAEVAQDGSDLGAIALLNEYGLKLLEAQK